ncbi:hypothetical protein EG878_14560 [Enterococcus faecalis]|nr:hypothetical protein EG878_14560 [Enterococcus faecalis]
MYDLCVKLKKLPSEILNEDAELMEQFVVVQQAINKTENDMNKKKGSRDKREELKAKYKGHSARKGG